MQSTSRAAFRRQASKREATDVLSWTAGTLVVLTIFYSVAVGTTSEVLATHAVEAIALLVGAVLSRQKWMRPEMAPWLVALCAEVVVGGFLYENYSDPSEVSMGFLMIVMVASVPFILDPVVATVAAAPMVVSAYVMSVSAHAGHAARWAIAAFSALVVGGLLLRTRLRALDALGEALAANEALATQDPLSCLLNRRGLEDRIPAIVAIAARTREPIFLAIVDIDGLKRANDDFGHVFGDEVIVAVATALHQVVREGDLVGRWGGDEFLIIGLGQPPDPEGFTRRIRNSIAEGGIDLGRWPGWVSIGVAVANAAGFSLDAVLREADTNLYERRRDRRPTA